MMRLIESDDQAQMKQRSTLSASARLVALPAWPPTSIHESFWTRQSVLRRCALRDENARSAELSKILENLRVARNAVHTCLVLVKPRGFPSGESGLPWEERAGRSRKVFDAEETMAASLPAIDFIIEGVEVDFARLAVSAGRPKDEWKALFVAALALGWEKLTGKLPGRTAAGGDFVNFLSSAWASLPGGEPPEINWERPIRRDNISSSS
jgi:hypothetical protein